MERKQQNNNNNTIQEDEDESLLGRNSSQSQDLEKQQKQQAKLSVFHKQRQYPKLLNNNNRQQQQRKNRGIQGCIVVTITLLFCFSFLFLMHIYDKEHMGFKSHFSFVQKKSDNLKILTPDLDKNQYKYLQLDNKMKVLLINDPESSYSSAALSVQTGSWSDPAEYPGLSHFLEHMLFLSTPVTLDDLLYDNNGMSNAYTSGVNTCYFFDVSSYGYEDSLSVFAQMFREPVFKQEDVAKESSAVNGEYEIDIIQDGWRRQNLLSLLGKDDHPISKFTIGNDDTLKVDGVLEALEEYRKNNYSANQMSLVLTSPFDLEYLEELVKQSGFEDIQNLDREETIFEGEPFKEEYLGSLVKLDTDSPGILLSIMTEISSTKNLNDKYLDFVFSSLEITSQDGFTDYIKKSDLVEDFSYGVMVDENNFSIAVANFQLTEEGYEHFDEVIKMYYTALEKFKEDGNDQELFEQKKQLADLEFKFESFSGYGSDYAAEFADILNNISDPSTVLKHYYQYPEYNEQKIEQFASELIDVNKSIYVIQKNFKGENEQSQENSSELIQKNLNISFIQKAVAKTQKQQTLKNKSKSLSSKSQEQKQQEGQKKQQKQYNIKKNNNLIKNKTKKEKLVIVKDHMKYLNKKELKNYDPLFNMYWDSVKLSKKEKQQLQQIDEELYDVLQLPEYNDFIPKDLNLISLCRDPNLVLDLSFQLDSILFNDDGKYYEQTQNYTQQQEFNEEQIDYYNQDNSNRFQYQEFKGNLDDENKCTHEANQYEMTHKYPELIKNDMRGKMFYKLDRSFGKPVSSFQTEITSNNLISSAKSNLSLQALNLVIRNRINKEFYQQQQAGYYIDVTASQTGLLVDIQGWSDGFSETVSKIFITLQKLEIGKNELKQAKLFILDQLQDEQTFNPLQQITKIKIPQFLQKPYRSTDEYLEILETLDQEYVQQTKNELFESFKMNTLVYGNIRAKEATLLYDNITSLFNSSFKKVDDFVQYQHISNLEEKSYVYRGFTEGPENELNSATVNYYQTGERTLKNQVAGDLLENMISTFFFRYLRTERELGYQATAQRVQLACVTGFIVLVQGSKEPPHVVDRIIEEGLLELESELKDMSEEEYLDMQGSTISVMDLEFSSVEEKADYFFSQITSGQFLFDENELKVQHTQKITKEDFIKFFEDTFKQKSGKLSVQVYSKQGIDQIPEKLLPNSKTFAKISPVMLNQTDELHNENDFSCRYESRYI